MKLKTKIMSYTFIKYRCPLQGEMQWMLKCNNSETLIQHTEKYLGTQIELSMQEVLTTEKIGHLRENKWADVVEVLSKIKGTHFIKESVIMENKVFQGKLKCMGIFDFILLRENGSYSLPGKEYEIIDEVTTEKLIYPHYNKELIRIIKWQGGTHFYAKIGNMDVVGDDGNQKWDTHKEAYSHALKELTK